VINLAFSLGVRTVTAGVGMLTHPQTGEPSPVAMEALARIGDIADGRGVRYALRPSADAPHSVVQMLDTIGCPALEVCVDAAALIMSGQNPVSLIERCAWRIGLIHARDANSGSVDRPGCETGFGDGEVDWIGMLGALSAVEFDGTFVARRLDASDPTTDLVRARELLTQYGSM
jgi:sugar phosphate isomerase/epimerase